MKHEETPKSILVGGADTVGGCGTKSMQQLTELDRKCISASHTMVRRLW